MRQKLTNEEKLRREIKKIDRHKKFLLMVENTISFILLSVVGALVISIFTFIGYGIAHFIACVETQWVSIIVNLTFGILLSTYYTITSKREQLNKKEKEESKGNENETD